MGLAIEPVGAEERGLLDAIIADAQNMQPRLVYGDWATDRGNPHGELISLQCARNDIETMFEDEPTQPGGAASAPARTDADNTRHAELAQRERELLAELDIQWCRQPASKQRLRRPPAPAWFHRGFVEQGGVRCSGEHFARYKHTLLRIAPFAALLEVTRLDDAEHLVAGDALGTYSHVVVDGNWLPSTAPLRAAQWTRLRSLEVSGLPLHHQGVADLVSGAMPELEHLAMRNCSLERGSLSALAEGGPAKLVSLDVRDNRVDDDELLALARARPLSRLEFDELSVRPEVARELTAIVAEVVGHRIYIHPPG